MNNLTGDTMQKYCVMNAGQALAYITDCCLATVADMATKKRKPKHEYSRQISIAQTACNWMRDFGIDASSTRAEDIIGKMTVEEWAKQFEM